MRFVDTPGFQHPQKIKAWFDAYSGSDNDVVPAFVEAHKKEDSFIHDLQLLNPLLDGSGIIYVVDGSRPVRSDDRAEMEILRRTGLPRLAIINSKDDDRDYTEDWKSAFLRNFNSVRVFNAHRASYSERLGLLQTLKGIDQDWEPALNLVIDTFTKDWTRRLSEAADLIVDHLDQCIRQKKEQENLQTGNRFRPRRIVNRLSKRNRTRRKRFVSIFTKTVPTSSVPGKPSFRLHFEFTKYFVMKRPRFWG